MSNNIPSRETYIKQPDTNKLDTLYDMAVSADTRLYRLEKRKRLDTTFAGFMGLIGGAAMMAGKWIITPGK